MNLRILALTLIGLAAAIAPSAINADTPGRHPAYLHARSNLRAAQFLLRVREEPNVTRHLNEADHEAEAAIGEVDRAAVLDRKTSTSIRVPISASNAANASAKLSNYCELPAPIWAEKKITAAPRLA